MLLPNDTEVNGMIGFLAGCMTGGVVGVFTMCLARAASAADSHTGNDE